MVILQPAPIILLTHLIITLLLLLKLPKTIKCLHKQSSDNVKNKCDRLIFLQRTNEEIIANIISSLKSNKTLSEIVYL